MYILMCLTTCMRPCVSMHTGACCVCVCVCVRAFLNVYVYLCEMATDEKGYEGS